MTWFAFKGSGSVYNLNGLAEKELILTGAHGYATEAEAVAHPNAEESGFQAALLATKQFTASLPAGGGSIGVQSGTTKAVTPATVTGFLGRLQSGTLWQRVIEVVVGGALLIIAVKGMSSPVTAPITQGIKKAGKPASKVGWFA